MIQVSDCCRASIEQSDYDAELDKYICPECGDVCEFREVPTPEEIAVVRAERRADR